MSDFLVIGADFHVEEPEEAWNYLLEKYRGDRRAEKRPRGGGKAKAAACSTAFRK